MDMARWVLGETALSPRVLSVGGRLGYVDDGTTPNTLIVFHDYPTAPLIFEVRGLPSGAGSKEMDKYRGREHRHGGGLRGRLDGHSQTTRSAKILDKDGRGDQEVHGQLQPLRQLH